MMPVLRGWGYLLRVVTVHVAVRIHRLSLVCGDLQPPSQRENSPLISLQFAQMIKSALLMACF